MTQSLHANFINAQAIKRMYKKRLHDIFILNLYLKLGAIYDENKHDCIYLELYNKIMGHFAVRFFVFLFLFFFLFNFTFVFTLVRLDFETRCGYFRLSPFDYAIATTVVCMFCALL